MPVCSIHTSRCKWEQSADLSPCETRQRFFYNVSVPSWAVIFSPLAHSRRFQTRSKRSLPSWWRVKVQLLPKLFGLEDRGRWIEADPLGRARPVFLESLLVGKMPRFHRSVLSLFKPHPGLILMSFWLRNISHSHFLRLLSACSFITAAFDIRVFAFIAITKFMNSLNMLSYDTTVICSKWSHISVYLYNC